MSHPVVPLARRHPRPRWKYPKWQRIAAIVRARCDYTCQVCGWRNPFPYPHAANRQMDIDHIIPRARGGTNDVDNLQLLCSTCNGKKGSRVSP
jgi:5-methylcytosine-specific restriction protein A